MIAVKITSDNCPGVPSLSCFIICTAHNPYLLILSNCNEWCFGKGFSWRVGRALRKGASLIQVPISLIQCLEKYSFFFFLAKAPKTSLNITKCSVRVSPFPYHLIINSSGFRISVLIREPAPAAALIISSMPKRPHAITLLKSTEDSWWRKAFRRQHIHRDPVRSVRWLDLRGSYPLSSNHPISILGQVRPSREREPQRDFQTGSEEATQSQAWPPKDWMQSSKTFCFFPPSWACPDT